MTVNENAGTVSVPILIAYPHSRPVDVTVTNISPGTAPGVLAEGPDLRVPSFTVRIAAGATSVPFKIEVIDDSVEEPIEFANFRISDVREVGGLGRRAYIPAATSDFTLGVRANDTSTPPVVQFSQSVIRVVEGTRSVEASVVLDKPWGLSVYVTIEQVSGSATYPEDIRYPQIVEVPAGATSVPFAVTAVSDSLNEAPAERADIRIATAVAATIGTRAVLTIGVFDPDPPAPTADPDIGWVDSGFQISEGPSGTSAVLSFGVLNEPDPEFGPVEVSLSVGVGSTAGADGDFTLSATSFTIEPGQTTAAVTITATPDASVEGTEVVVLILAVTSGSATISRSTIKGRIVDGTPGAGGSAELHVERIGSGSGFTGESLVQVAMPLDPPVTPANLPDFNIDGWPCDVLPMTYAIEDDTKVDTVRCVALVPNSSGAPSIPSPGTSPGRIEIAEGPGIKMQVPHLMPIALDGVYIELRASFSENAIYRAPLDGSGTVLATEVIRDGERVRQTRMLIEPRLIAQLSGGTGGTDNVGPQEVTDGIAGPAGEGGVGPDYAGPGGEGEGVNKDLEGDRGATPTGGGSDPKDGGTPREEMCGLIEVFVTERSDFEAMHLDVVFYNAKWDKDDDPHTVATAGDGPIWFRDLRLRGFDVGTHDVALAQERQLVHYVDGDTVMLAGPPQGNPGNSNLINPGQWFARRMVIYKRATVTGAIAKDIAERKDFAAMAEGDIGFTEGGWLGWQPVPKFSQLPSIQATPQQSQEVTGQWDRIRERGQRRLDITRDYFATGDFQRAGRDREDPPTRVTDCGWFKPWGAGAFGPFGDPRAPGQEQMELWGNQLPCWHNMFAEMLRTDGWIERDGIAIMDVESGKPATMEDFCSQTDGEVPYGFESYGYKFAWMVPAHMRHPDEDGVREQDELCRMDLPWNDRAAVQARGFDIRSEAGVNWQKINGVTDWAPCAFTHYSRMLSVVRPTAYLLDDPIARRCLEFRGLIASLGYGHKDVWQDGAKPWERFPRSRFNNNLKYITDNSLNADTLNRGRFADSNGMGRAAETPRGFAHPWAGILSWYHFADNAMREYLDGGSVARGGDGSIFTMMGEVAKHMVCGNGMLVSNADLSQYDDTPPDIPNRLGGVPGGQAIHGINEFWSVTKPYHHVYLEQVWTPLRKMLARDAAKAGWLDTAIAVLDIWEDAAEVHIPDTGMQWPRLAHGTIGTAGANNPALSVANARAGDGLWLYRPDGLLGTPPNQYFGFISPMDGVAMALSYRLRHGNWGGTLKMCKRQFGAPSSQTDAQFLKNLWTFVSEVGYARSAENTQICKVLPVIALLQQDGVTHPDMPS